MDTNRNYAHTLMYEERVRGLPHGIAPRAVRGSVPFSRVPWPCPGGELPKFSLFLQLTLGMMKAFANDEAVQNVNHTLVIHFYFFN